MTESKNCPDCGQPMILKKPQFPEGESSAFVADDQWICTNPKCGRVENVEKSN